MARKNLKLLVTYLKTLGLISTDPQLQRSMTLSRMNV